MLACARVGHNNPLCRANKTQWPHAPAECPHELEGKSRWPVQAAFGSPAKFAAKLVLGAVVPGGSAVIDLVGAALDCVHETVRDQIELDEARMPAATTADLQRLEGVLDLLGGDLGALTAQMAALEQVPDLAKQQLDVALATDDRCRAALGKLDGLARGFDVLREQNAKILKGQGYAAGMLEEILPIMRRMAGIADYVEELHAAGVSGSEFRSLIAVFRDGQRALGKGGSPRPGRSCRRRRRPGRPRGRPPWPWRRCRPWATTCRRRHCRLGGPCGCGRATRSWANCIAASRRSAAGRRRLRSRACGGRAEGWRDPVLDGWRLELLLGRGGWGQVFKACRGEEVRALKVMHPELSNDPAFVERFKAEILTLAGLRGHKHLVEIHGFGKDADCWYFLMEFIKGVSLEQYLMKNGGLSAKQALPLFTRLADGLALAHARGVVHGDVKPGNIMLRAPNGVPVLVDFGLASAGDGAGLTRTGQSAGYTPMFAAPEQLRGKAADARSDVYAAGVHRCCTRHELRQAGSAGHAAINMNRNISRWKRRLRRSADDYCSGA